MHVGGGVRLINITFHGIGPRTRALQEGEDRVWICRERFLAVLDAIAGRDEVRITFDDGNASDREIALPALADRGLTAAFFVVAGRLRTREFLDPAGLRELAGAGMTIGSHGMRHVPWRSLDPAGLREEIVDAKQILEDAVEGPVTDAACPFGAYERRSLAALRHAGFTRVYTSDRGAARAGDWLQARTTMAENSALEPILSGSSPSLRRRVELTAKRWR
jgi:peptidoglycan/xylan/chitin deacetylase (PgdA/CDA1 family)